LHPISLDLKPVSFPATITKPDLIKL
jgi:hypothetical protein